MQFPLLGKGETNTDLFAMKGTYLGEFEELVLLTVGILTDDAYGLAITDELESRTKRNVTISSVHKSLVRLESKGFLKSSMGGASKERGGRAKKLYQLTNSGKNTVNESRRLRNHMWNDVPKIVWEGGEL
ncbi:MAG: PadR family transcriptional regulator [Cyclobacteriaceae bacterium]